MGVGAELPAHLATLRAYFLLGRGDLFQTFLLEACSSITYPSLATHASDNCVIAIRSCVCT